MRRRTFSSSSSVYSWVRSTASAAGLVLAATFPASKHVCQIIYEILKPHSETGFVVSRMSMSIPTCKDPQIFPKNIMSYASRWVAQPSVKGQRFSRPRRTSSLGVLPADYNFLLISSASADETSAKSSKWHWSHLSLQFACIPPRGCAAI